MAGPIAYLLPSGVDAGLISKSPIETISQRRNYFRYFWGSETKKKKKKKRDPIIISHPPPPRLPEKKITLKPILRHPGGMDPRIDASPYLWPHDSSFDPTTTALVVIDMQMDFCSPDGYLAHQGYDITPVRSIIPRLLTLLTSFRTAGFPIYHTREGHRPDLSTLSSREYARSRNNPSGKGIGDLGPLGRLLIRGEKGHDIIPELTPLPGENIIDKPGRSAFQHTEFRLMLNVKGIRNLVLCGVTTDVCVTSTMRDANDNGFDCLIVEDATAASEEGSHVAAVEMVKTEGGIFGAVSSTEKILKALGVGKEASGEGLVNFGGVDRKEGVVKKTAFITPDEIKEMMS